MELCFGLLSRLFILRNIDNIHLILTKTSDDMEKEKRPKRETDQSFHPQDRNAIINMGVVGVRDMIETEELVFLKGKKKSCGNI